MLGHCFHTMLRNRSLRAAMAIMAFVSLATGTSPRAQAGPFTPKLVYDSNVASTEPLSALTANATNKVAGKFYFPVITDGWQLDTVSLLLSSVPAGTVTLQLWTDAGTTPGIPIPQATFTSPSTWTAGGMNLFRSNYYAPAPNTSYWLVLSGSTGNSAAWERTDGTPIVPSGTPIMTNAALYSGGTWLPQVANQPLMMDVRAVPEPSTYAMGLAGLGVTGLSALRRRRRKAALRARQQAAAL